MCLLWKIKDQSICLHANTEAQQNTLMTHTSVSYAIADTHLCCLMKKTICEFKKVMGFVLAVIWDHSSFILS